MWYNDSQISVSISFHFLVCITLFIFLLPSPFSLTFYQFLSVSLPPNTNQFFFICDTWRCQWRICVRTSFSPWFSTLSSDALDLHCYRKILYRLRLEYLLLRRRFKVLSSLYNFLHCFSFFSLFKLEIQIVGYRWLVISRSLVNHFLLVIYSGYCLCAKVGYNRRILGKFFCYDIFRVWSRLCNVFQTLIWNSKVRRFVLLELKRDSFLLRLRVKLVIEDCLVLNFTFDCLGQSLQCLWNLDLD